MPEDKRGYLIPTPIDPGAERCIAVFIPDDDRALSDFVGAYEFFTKWVAHAKTGGTEARDRAAAWRRAYDRTWDEGLLCVTMTELQDLIDAINDCCTNIIAEMNESQTINNNLINIQQELVNQQEFNFIIDCIDCETRPPYAEPPIIPPVDPNDPPGVPTSDEWYQYLCRAANYTIQQLLENVVAYAYQQLSAGARFTIQELLTMILSTGFTPSWQNIVTLYELFQTLYDAGELLNLNIGVAVISSDLVCCIYTSNGPYEYIVCKQNLFAANSTPQNVQDYVNAMISNNVLNDIYSHSLNIPEDFVEVYDCETECVQQQVGQWYPEEVRLGGDTEYIFTSNSLAGFRVVGQFTAGNITSLRLDVENDYEYDDVGLTAVSFTIDEVSLDGLLDDCSLWEFGGDNHAQSLAACNGGDTVLCMVQGTTQPPGVWDHIFTYQLDEHIIGRFGFGQFTYQPPDRAVTFEITNFTRHFLP